MASRVNRKTKRASGYYRLQPIFGDGDKEPFEIGGVTHVIEGHLDGFAVISVPETTTQAMALDQEHQFAEHLKQPVLIVGHNVTFLKATLMTGKEVAELQKAAEENASDSAE